MSSFFLHEAVFSDELIVRKSVEYFSDPEPCMIHRSAVASRLLAELQTALRVPCPRQALAPYLQDALPWPPGAAAAQMEDAAGTKP